MKRQTRLRRRLSPFDGLFEIWNLTDTWEILGKYRNFFVQTHGDYGFYIEKVVTKFPEEGPDHEGIIFYFYRNRVALESHVYAPGVPFRKTLWEEHGPIPCDLDTKHNITAPHSHYESLFRKHLGRDDIQVSIEDLDSYIRSKSDATDHHKLRLSRLARAFACYGSFISAFFKPGDLQ